MILFLICSLCSQRNHSKNKSNFHREKRKITRTSILNSHFHSECWQQVVSNEQPEKKKTDISPLNSLMTHMNFLRILKHSCFKKFWHQSQHYFKRKTFLRFKLQTCSIRLYCHPEMRNPFLSGFWDTWNMPVSCGLLQAPPGFEEGIKSRQWIQQPQILILTQSADLVGLFPFNTMIQIHRIFFHFL